MFEGVCEWLKLLYTHSNSLSSLAPTLHGLHNVAQYLLGPRRRDAEICNHGHEGIDGHVRAGIFGYPRLQFTHALGRRVDVESGRQSPEFPIHMQEAVIA